MKVLVKGVIYDSTKQPILVVFDDNEKGMFGDMERFVSAPDSSTVEERHKLIHTDLNKYGAGWNYSKIQEPCFVCKVEDELGEERGTQSHPINCGWRAGKERDAYKKALEEIYDLCYYSNGKKLEELLTQIKNTSIKALVHKHDIKEGETKEKTYYFMSFMHSTIRGEYCASAAMDTHPMDWQMEVNKTNPGQYVLTNWREITEEEYDKYKVGLKGSDIE